MPNSIIYFILVITLKALSLDNVKGQDILNLNLTDTFLLDEDQKISLIKLERGIYPKMVGTNFKIGTNTFSIAITDSNKNKVYGDVSNDYIHVTPYKNNKVPQAPVISSNVITFKDSLIVLFDDIPYKIKVIDKKIPSITIKKLKNDKNIIPDIECNNNISSLAINDIFTGKHMSEYNLESGITLLYFWGTWCEGCIKQTAIIRQLAEDLTKTGNFNFVLFNSKDDLNVAKAYLKRNKLDRYANFSSSEEALKLFSISAYPTFLLYNNNKYLGRYTNIENVKNKLISEK